MASSSTVNFEAGSESLEDKKSVRTSPEKYCCRICAKTYSSKGNLVQHMETHVIFSDDANAKNDFSFDCSHCSKQFSQLRYLLAHKKRCPSKERRVYSHSCTLCGKTFFRLSHLRRHQEHHIKLKAYSCAVCDRSFVQSHHLKRHMASNAHLKNLSSSDSASTSKKTAPPKRHRCPFCPKTFSTLWELQRHRNAVHPYALTKVVSGKKAVEKPVASTTMVEKKISILKCRRCGKRFDNIRLYGNHLEWHNSKRPHACEICGLAFVRRLELETHTASRHKIGRMFECVQCGDTFAQRHQIDRHFRSRHPPTHTADSRDDSRKIKCSPTALFCKYCAAVILGVKNYHEHISAQHFRKIIVGEKVEVENEKMSEETEIEDPEVPSAIGEDEVPKSQEECEKDSGSETVKNIRIVVDIAKKSGQVNMLHLGPLLPSWLLKLQPSFSTLDVDFTSNSRPLCAGENIVLTLPLPENAVVEKRTIRLSYST